MTTAEYAEKYGITLRRALYLARTGQTGAKKVRVGDWTPKGGKGRGFWDFEDEPPAPPTPRYKPVPGYLSVGEYRIARNRSVAGVRRLIKQGKLKCDIIDGRKMIPEDAEPEVKVYYREKPRKKEAGEEKTPDVPPEGYITVERGRELLGISPAKMRALMEDLDMPAESGTLKEDRARRMLADKKEWESDKKTVEEYRKEKGVSPETVVKWIRAEKVRAIESPFDRRMYILGPGGRKKHGGRKLDEAMKALRKYNEEHGTKYDYGEATARGII